MDQSKKTMRHFYCRDVLWETFEQMANDFDCSIDYLINESMRYYARSKNYPAAGAGASSASPTNPPVSAAAGATANLQNRRPGSPTSPPGSLPTGQMAAQPAVAPQARRPASPTPAPHVAGAPAAAPPGPPPRPSGVIPVPSAPAPAANPTGQMAAVGGGATLYLMFNGQRFSVTKDQFIIGRGSKTSDLPIKDGNISRKHAAVIRRNGTFYIKDLGSTNGIDYKGMRIDNKRIDEGDVFHLCDYELKFTYRAE